MAYTTNSTIYPPRFLPPPHLHLYQLLCLHNLLHFFLHFLAYLHYHVHLHQHLLALQLQTSTTASNTTTISPLQ